VTKTAQTMQSNTGNMAAMMNAKESSKAIAVSSWVAQQGITCLRDGSIAGTFTQVISSMKFSSFSSGSLALFPVWQDSCLGFLFQVSFLGDYCIAHYTWSLDLYSH